MWHRLTPLRIALLLGVLLSILRFGGCRYLELIDVRAVDYRLLQRGPQPATPEVVIVAIDDRSLEEVGRWPWSRRLMAEIVNRLVAADAAVIGFDIVQSEATQDIGLEGLRAQVPGIDDRTWETLRHALRPGAAEDEELVNAVRASNRTALGYFFDFDAKQPPRQQQRVSTYNAVQHSRSGAGEQRMPAAPFARDNLPELTTAAREVGYFNFLPDSDGSYRRVPLAIRYGDDIALPLSLAVLRVYQPGIPLSIRIADFGVESVRLGATSIPLAEDGQMLINFRGPGKTFPHVTARDLLAGKVPPETFRRKIVLVGVTAAALADVRVTPFDGVFPGVEIHANVLDNILRREFILQPKWIVLVEIGVIFLAVTILGVALHYARGVYGALVAALLLGSYLITSQGLFVWYGLPLSLVYPLLAIGLTYTTIGVQHYVVEEREKRKIRNAFGLYLTPEVARLVSDHPELLALGGETRDLTVLFSDIRGFTTVSERFQDDPHTLVALLNQFLGRMTDVIFSHDGTLDKYVGDEIMAVWGAPIPQTDHAARACRGGLEMMADLERLNEEFKQRGWPPLDIGVGINSGPMVVGNMGSERRLSYTVVGDNVNLGARLEGLNKMYGTHVIASESTVQAAGDGVVVRELDLVRVKGKYQGVRIFEIIALAEERDKWIEFVKLFDAGVHAYRMRQWDEAIAAFGAILETHPNDGPARLYLGRCRGMLDTPPAADWDGVTVMETK